MTDLLIRPATAADLPLLHPVIERAYRGETARRGWSHEADIIEGPRIERATLEAMITTPGERLLVAEQAGRPIGCVHLTDKGAGLAYLGLLCIDPDLQAAGLGRRLIAAAEQEAATGFGARTIEMTVIDSRSELIAYYERRGYRRTGERRPFPIALVPPLGMIVLAKPLSAAAA